MRSRRPCAARNTSVSLTAYEREAILRRAGDIADARVDDLARTISGETGKPIGEAKGEASRVGDLLRLSGFEGSQLYGDSLPLDAAPNGGTSRLGFTLRQPCGVVVAITPFNFPALLVVHKIGPALAAGNAVVLKPRAPDASDRAEALRDPSRGGPAPRSDLVPHGSRARCWVTRCAPIPAFARSASPAVQRPASGSRASRA